MLAPSPAARRRAAALRLAGYLAVAVLLSWPLAPRLGRAMPGYPTVDAFDTVMLRGLVARLALHPAEWGRTPAIYFPTGFPVLELMPDLLDHLTALPLALALPFPWDDGLWWLAVLAGSGLAAHHLGRRLGGGEASGWLAGLAWMSAEPQAREANLHHAPQALAGLALSLVALSYWYAGLFLILGALPLLAGLRRRDLLVVGLTGAVLCLPPLAPQLLRWDALPLTGPRARPTMTGLPPGFAALDAADAFVAAHGGDPLFWLRRAPADIANRVSLVLVLAAVLGWRGARGRGRAALLWMALLGGVMAMGTHLRLGADLVLVDGSPVRLPFAWFRELHPFLGRLDWPERWGMLVPLGLLPLAARAPRPGLLAGLVLAENLAMSANLPLQTTDVSGQRCQAELAATGGAVLELPLKRGPDTAGRVGLHQRFHRRPVVNPVLLPPGAEPPADWRRWSREQPFLAWVRRFEEGRWPADPGAEAIRDLRRAGVGAIAVDVEPGGALSPGGIHRYSAGLTRVLGPPVDLGCALLWWLDPDHPRPAGLDREAAEAWRAARAAALEADPVPALDTLITPAWNALRPRPGGG